MSKKREIAQYKKKTKANNDMYILEMTKSQTTAHAHILNTNVTFCKKKKTGNTWVTQKKKTQPNNGRKEGVKQKLNKHNNAKSKHKIKGKQISIN